MLMMTPPVETSTHFSTRWCCAFRIGQPFFLPSNSQDTEMQITPSQLVFKMWGSSEFNVSCRNGHLTMSSASFCASSASLNPAAPGRGQGEFSKTPRCCVDKNNFKMKHLLPSEPP
jgi:hypothetical protein